MSPPTEQLIRDYLNRLSVAARGQLGPEDRRALTARTRDFIERKTGLAGPPTAVEVARLLAGLGDPGGLVAQEVRRLAVLRGEDASEQPARDGFLARVLHRDPSTPASWHWPPQPGSRADWQRRLMDPAAASGPGESTGEEAASPAAGGRSGPRPSAGTASAPSTGGSTPAGRAAEARGADVAASPGPRASTAAEPSLQVPAQPGPPDRADRPVPRLTIVPPPSDSEAAGSGGPEPAGSHRVPVVGAECGASQSPRASSAERGASQSPRASGAERGGPQGVRPGGPESSGADRGPQAHPDSHARPGVRARADAVVGWARARPLEAAAVVVLGVGGASFPPIWLAGAALALVSKVWDYRDKWLGLAGPVLLTVTGIAVGLDAAGRGGTMGHHLHVAWVFAVTVSRVSAALGAVYLAWRSVNERKAPEVPPWNKPRKIS